MDLPKKMPRAALAKAAAAAEIPDEKKRVVVNRYRVEKKLGSGNFGTAYLVKDLKAKTSTDELKVLKQIPCGDLQPDETVDAMHEAKLLSRLDNSGIVKFHDSFMDNEFFCIVTEYCEGGDLDDYVVRMKKRGQSIPEQQVMDWTVELLLAVHYMHCRRVLHRDLKARNIFLKNNHIKIGDFGISRILMGTADMATTFTGTPYYMSPEVLKHEGYNSKSDVWSIGCIIFELCSQRHAFEGQGLMGVMYKIVEGDCPALPDKYSKNLSQLIKNIFTKEPEKRPSASEVLKMPFISRHLEKMHMSSAKHSENADEDAEALQITLQKKHHMKDLRTKTEEDKLKHLTPRERMRIRKQQEADKKARELAEAARANLHGNITRKQHFQDQNKQADPAPWTGSVRREKTFALPEDATYVANQSPFRPKTAPGLDHTSEQLNDVSMSVILSESSESDQDEELTVIPKIKSSTLPPNQTVLLKSSRLLGAQRNLDDRPITPMKDRMVYDLKHSSLDFRDGVPDDPRVAETYYSQFEEFEEDKDTSNDSADIENIDGEETAHEDGAPNESFDAQEHTVIPNEEYEGTLIGHLGGSGEKTLKAGGTLIAGITLTSGTLAGDEEELIEHMENHLHTAQHIADEDDYNEDTINLADDTVAGAYGPTARSIKIKNLRKNGEVKLGKEAFKKAYEFLKKMRYGDDSATSTVDENYIMNQLRKITPQVTECFLIDQLLFLEKQADMERNC